MMPLILAFKNIISRKSSVFIVLFMTLAAALLSVTNAIFDSTERGVGDLFRQSFTGDFVIRPTADFQASLFGDETPVTGDLTELLRLVPYTEIEETLRQSKAVKNFVPQLTGYARVENGSEKTDRILFGVSGARYAELMTNLSIISGKAYGDFESGAMLEKSIAQRLKAQVGDEIQFAVADGMTFRIRTAKVSAIYEYAAPHEIFGKFILLDTMTFRSLFDISDAQADGMEINSEQSSLLGGDLDWDALFEEGGDVSVAEFNSAYKSEAEPVNVENYDAKQENELDFEAHAGESGNAFSETPEALGTTWNFIVCRLSKNFSAWRAVRSLNKTFRQNGWPVEAVSWRHGAGSTVLYLHWLRLILNVGILIVVAAGFIVINNTLVVNVLDRTREIGTMRAIGASRLFVSLECLAETFILALVAALLGNVLGALAAKIITNFHIVFGNEFLRQLFGGEAVSLAVSWQNVRNIFALMLALGAIGWIYPVVTATKVSPLEAMSGAK